MEADYAAANPTSEASVSHDIASRLRALADRVERGSKDEDVVCIIMGGADPSIYATGRSCAVALHRAKSYLDGVIADTEHSAGSLN